MVCRYFFKERNASVASASLYVEGELRVAAATAAFVYEQEVSESLEEVEKRDKLVFVLVEVLGKLAVFELVGKCYA